MPTQSRERIIICQANRADDFELRRVLRENPMEGRIRVAFAREPSYFDAAQVEGDVVDVIVAKTMPSEKIVGFGTRSEKHCFVNGRPGRIGYLSGLRIQAEYRNGLVLAKGYRLLKQAHGAGSVQLYLTTIIDDNDQAKKILTSGKAGLPTYHDLGLFYTLSIRPSAHRNGNSQKGVRIRTAAKKDIKSLVRFLNQHGSQRQFYPVYKEEHFCQTQGLLRGLKLEKVYLAKENDRIVGSLAIWNQKAFKQSIIAGYGRSVRILRRAYNLFTAINKRPTLPNPGTYLNCQSLALVCIEKDRLEIFDTLLQNVLHNAHESKNLHSVLIGFHERDPLLAIARQRPHVEYLSRLYVVHWQDGDSAFHSLDGRIPYLELGAL